MGTLTDKLKGLIDRIEDTSFYDGVMKDIRRVREQGERPREDVTEIDVYICDLCMSKANRGEIIQCGFCGRWVCLERCWVADEKSCISCAGIIRLHRESIGHLKEIITEIGRIVESNNKRSHSKG